MSSLATSQASTSMRYLVRLSVIMTMLGAFSLSCASRPLSFLRASLMSLWHCFLRSLEVMKRLYQGKFFLMVSTIALKSLFSLNDFRNSYYRSSHQTLSNPLQIYLFLFLSLQYICDFPFIPTPNLFTYNEQHIPQCYLIQCLSNCRLSQYWTATYTLATSCRVRVGEGILKAFLTVLRKLRQSSGTMSVLHRSIKSSTSERCSLDVGVISTR